MNIFGGWDTPNFKGDIFYFILFCLYFGSLMLYRNEFEIEIIIFVLQTELWIPPFSILACIMYTAREIKEIMCHLVCFISLAVYMLEG